MTAELSPEPIRFRDWIGRRLGLKFDDGKLGFLADVLGRRAVAGGLTSQAYLARLEAAGIEAEIPVLATELTVSETYFFRHIDQLRAFAEVALPAAQAARAADRRLNLLCAGCASGEEPYSLAMLVRERVRDPGWTVTIRALDINPAMLAKAARGRYSAWALRETPMDVRRRWFRSTGAEFILDESIRSAVTLHETNLVQADAELWRPDVYDVIFCRNVLMYLTADNAHALVARLTRSLVPGGHLFLGHAETLRGLSNDYTLRHTHGAFYYQRKPGPSATAARSATAVRDGGAKAAAESGWVKPWLDAVQHAAERIQALTERPDTEFAPGRGPTPVGVAESATTLPLVFALLEQERFSEALDAVAGAALEAERDPALPLLRAALLLHCGQFSAAEQASRQLLDREGLSTGAHYLLALCREHVGDLQGALDHDCAAVYLDPSFAMPRLHLGLMARRAGDSTGAHRELGQALSLLEREDSSRLLLFGGGFGREVLIGLCRAELLSMGAAP